MIITSDNGTEGDGLEHKQQVERWPGKEEPKRKQKHTTSGIRLSTPSQLLVRRLVVYGQGSGGDLSYPRAIVVRRMKTRGVGL